MPKVSNWVWQFCLVGIVCVSFCWGQYLPTYRGHLLAAQNRAVGVYAVNETSQDPPATNSHFPDKPSQQEALTDAWSLYCRGDFPAAVSKYQQILKDDPKSGEAYAGLTRVYLKQKDLQSASDTVSKGLAQSDLASLRVASGEVLFRQGKIYEAEQEWVKVINSGHADARAYMGLSRVSNAVAMHKRGKAMIDKARELDPADPDIQRRWTETLTRAERIRNLEEYLSGPNDEDAEHRLSMRHYLEYLKGRAQTRGSCKMVGKVTATETPLVHLMRNADHIRGYGLTIKANDRKATLMLDTGASGIVLERGVAEKAGITKLSDTTVSGIGDKGAKNGYIGMVKTLVVGGHEFQNCPVEVIDSRSAIGDQGLIGADVFDDFLVDIDFPRGRLRLSELPKRPEDASPATALHTDEDEDEDGDASENQDANQQGLAETAPRRTRFHDAYIAPEMKSYIRIFRFRHEILIPTSVSDTPNKLFLIDSGAFLNNIAPAAAREVTKVHGSTDIRVSGISGQVNQVYSADKAVLRVGHLRQENQGLISFDLTSLSEHTETEVSGILGFEMLRLLDVKIDYRDNLVDLTFDPKLPHPPL